MDQSPFVIILVADGVRPDTLCAALHDGALPALARFREEGTYHTITTAFPSVTGPAYAPFLTGCYPGHAGLPGLRWYDRARTTCRWPSYARSYVGIEMESVDSDLSPQLSTLFEVADSSLGALSVIHRGLAPRNRLERGVGFALRAGLTHFRGNVRGWLGIDRDMGDTLVRRIRAERPALTFAAFTGVDKTSHATGHDAPIVREALHIVDDVVARIRADAERDGVWERTHVWIVSDHGHSPVAHHCDLADLLRGRGLRVLAHPRILTRDPEIAVMMIGNAMAHIYVNLQERERLFWNTLRKRAVGTTTWEIASLARWLGELPAVDLTFLPTSPTSCDIARHARHATMYGNDPVSAQETLDASPSPAHATWLWATLSWTESPRDRRFTYVPVRGDPLGIGAHNDIDANDAYDVTFASEYPDALVQIASICSSPRSGDIILSAARQWDFRGRYEPIPHVSSHGALHAEHMLVPFLTNHPVDGIPRRTVDVMPSAAALLGKTVDNVDGRSFMMRS